MAVILGIDAGGTFTDGALIDAATGKVLRGTKTATLHHALQSSIRACLAAFSEEELRDLVAVCLSTTLATNALVEGHGGREGLILIGERPKGTLPSTQVVQIAGKEEAAVWLRTAVRRKLGGSILQAGLYFHSPDGLQEARSEAAELLLRGGTELLHLRPRLEAPLVAIGAPSAAWADGIREWMDAEILHPAHAEIAGAVGAAVGRRLEQAALLIRLDPVTKRYTLFAPDGRSEHERLEEATEAARRRGAAYTAARLGAGEHTVHEQIRDSVDAEGSFVERRIVVTASAEAGD